MIKFAKLFLFSLTATILFNLNGKVFAETNLGSARCPQSPDPGLASICGYVKSSEPIEETQSDGSKVLIERKGLEGVSVYLYECVNESDSCKLNGNLGHLMPATYTDSDGKFHLLMRKVDDLITLKGIDGSPDINSASVPSKRRYLVFVCGNKFAGMKIIPSYTDMTEVLMEAQCPSFSVYRPPDIYYKLVGPQSQLANHMGTDDPNSALDPNGRLPTEAGYITHLTTQVYFQNIASTQNLNIDLKLENADPRFTKTIGSDFINDVNFNKLTIGLGNTYFWDNPDIKQPDQGAFWELDCAWKYKKVPEIKKYCMGQNSSVTSGNREDKIDEYELRLYGKLEDPSMPSYIDFIIQNKLPNIPPKNHILFYKELPVRQDIYEYLQDPTDIARANAILFSNCLGDVFLRREGQVKKDNFAPCSLYQECNETVNSESTNNSQTTGSPARNLATPSTFEDRFNQDVDRDTEVCKMNPDNGGEAAVKIRDIQPPWDSNASKYKLDKSYWNTEFLYYFGKNAVAAKYGLKFQTIFDSPYANPTAIDPKAMRAQNETIGIPQQDGTSVVFQNSQNTPNNGLPGLMDIVSNKATGTTRNSIAGVISEPFKDSDYEKKVLSGIGVGTVGPRLYKNGEWSNINLGELNPGEGQEMVIIRPTKESKNNDLTMRTNTINKSAKNFNDNHYPFRDYLAYTPYTIYGNPDSTKAPKLPPDGTRTQTTGIYDTSVALDRYILLRTKAFPKFTCPACDFYDSLLSTLYGTGKLDFSDPDQVASAQAVLGGELWNVVSAWWKQFKNSLFGIAGESEKKDFFDRKHSDVLGDLEEIDTLKAYFMLSEENFLEKFPMPPIASLMPEDWGGTDPASQACYPWNKLGINAKCDTYPELKVLSGGKTQTVSRTCRVDLCRRTATIISCKCTRPKPGTGSEQGYSVKGCTPYNETDVAITNEKCDTADTADVERRLVCADKQTTCTVEGDIIGAKPPYDSKPEKECIQTTYQPEIEATIKKMYENSNLEYCNGSLFSSNPLETSVGIKSSVDTPSCIVSVAGPYTCGGDLNKDSTLEVKSQKLIISPSSPSIPIDNVRITNNEMAQLFRTPTCSNFVYSAAGFDSGGSSVRNLKFNDISKRVDVLVAPGGDSENPAIVRSTFGSPASNNSSQYNPVEYFCNNSALGATGSWDCPINPVPNPEFVNINNLKVKSGCKLNPSPTCNNLVFGEGYVDKGSPAIPACLKMYYPTFPTPSTSGIFSDLFVKVISAAASKYDVPASVLLAYMSRLGKLQPYLYYFSKEGEVDFFEASAPWYGSFSPAIPCDDTGLGPQGPFDWRKYWFNYTLVGVNGKTKSRDALNEISANRGNTASRCNFIDAAYTAAAAISSLNKGCSSSWGSYQKALYSLLGVTDGSFEAAGNTHKAIFEACR